MKVTAKDASYSVQILEKIKVVAELKDEQWVFQIPLLGKAEKRSGCYSSKLSFPMIDYIGDEPKKEGTYILFCKCFSVLSRNHPIIARGNFLQVIKVTAPQHF